MLGVARAERELEPRMNGDAEQAARAEGPSSVWAIGGVGIGGVVADRADVEQRRGDGLQVEPSVEPARRGLGRQEQLNQQRDR